jgi:hypothetical protein
MTKKILLGLGIVAIIFGLIVAVQNQAEAGTMEKDSMMEDKMMMGKMMTEAQYVKGELTSPADDKPFGGEAVGTYYIRVRGDDQVRVFAKLDTSPSQDSVFEGWLVDVDSDYKLSLGKTNHRDVLFFTQRMVNPWIYDVLVITQEPMDDTDPSPHTPIGGSPLGASFGQ